MVYVIILVFSLAGHGGTRYETLRCHNWDCVQEVMKFSKESRALQRIRVYEGEPVLLPSREAVFPPKIDYWLH